MNIASHSLEPVDAPQPVAALLFFSTRQDAGSPTLLVTRHAIQTTAQGPVIGPGHGFTARDLQELDDLLHNHRSQPPAPHLLPAHVLSYGDGVTAWLLPAAVRPMHFRSGNQPLHLHVPWPTLLLAVAEESRRLYVAALARRRRPVHNTALYHSPLMNVSVHGQVCTGNADLPTATGLDALTGWQQVLTDTFFTHVSHSETLWLPSGNSTTKPTPKKPTTDPGRSRSRRRSVDTAAHLKFWRRLAAQQATRFPRDCLVPMGMTLAPWLQRVAGQQWV